MSHLSFEALFDAPAPEFSKMDLPVELAHISAARRGDKASFQALLRQYIPALRKLVAAEQRRTDHQVELDETRANVLAAFTEAIHDVADGYPLVVQLRASTHQTADEYHLVKAVSIPPRTRQRFLALVREHAGDVTAAAAAVEADPVAAHMTLDVFHAAREAMSDWDSIEGATDALRATIVDSGSGDVVPSVFSIREERGYSTADQKFDTDRAFAAVGDDAAKVCRMAYGFSEYMPLPDAEIAHRMGYSRSKVQRIRQGALDTMHAAICGGDEDPRCARPEDHLWSYERLKALSEADMRRLLAKLDAKADAA